MRIPTRKIYRAFPELDAFSDEHCKLLMRRVRLNLLAQLMLFVFTFGALVGAFLVLINVVGLVEFSWPKRRFSAEVELLTRLLLVFVPTALAALLTRDVMLRTLLKRSLRLEIERVRCIRCKHILIAQRVVDDAVRCPECGELWPLGELGLTEDDLLPPQTSPVGG